MNGDNKNMLLAIVLSAIVLIGWQYFVGLPQMHSQQEAAQKASELQKTPNAPGTGAPGASAPGTAPGQPGAATVPGAAGAPTTFASRAEAVAATPRLPIETPRYMGSIALKGGRIDDLALRTYHETVDPSSPNIVLLSPSGTPIVPANHHDRLENEGPYYAEFGWAAQPGSNVKVPGPDTLWTAKTQGPLTSAAPAVLEWDNGAGLLFRRTIAVDDSQMFTVTDAVENKGTGEVTLSPYALVSRHGTPVVAGYYILHEGLIGQIGDNGLEAYKYSAIDKDVSKEWKAKSGWLGITDKYWATTIIPDQAAPYTARFSSTDRAGIKTYQTDILFDPRAIAPGASAENAVRVFSGAKEVALVDGYEKSLGVAHFDLLIDWGWFYFITKPLFKLIDWLYHFTGNFGVSILIVTLLLKICFFPLANRSYESMSKMKKVQPEMQAIRERFADDRMKQQQATMELYKREKINPVSGCVPVMLQIPVFFALYKVLFVTIEMRHQPFFGWIHDLSAPDPTTIFNLFGLIPWTPPVFLMLGIWPIIMGITMFLQMQLNPAPPDPVQAQLFRWMPLFFTFMLGSFPAGLVIYWTWNNTLTILQQSFIMKKNGVKVELWGNLRSLFVRKPKDAGPDVKPDGKGGKPAPGKS